MGIVLYMFAVLLIDETTAGIVRKPPAFATPVYSDAYLPAAMQVIFHAVDQLKHIQIEELEQNTSSSPSTSPHPPGQHQPLPTISVPSGSTQTTTVSHEEPNEETPEMNQEMSVIGQEMQELNQEKGEKLYGTAEVNQEKEESNQEEPEVDQEKPDDDCRIATSGNDNESSKTGPNSEANETIPLLIGLKIDDKNKTESPGSLETSGNGSNALDAKKRPSVDSIVKEIYDIVKPSSSSSSSSSSEESGECIESKNSSEESSEERESFEDQEDDTRFMLLGERVVQVPRPSLMGYLLRIRLPANPSLRQLAGLYDALSKDARKQGFAKYAGYSETVLKALETSAGGGAGQQMKLLLELAVEKNELTMDDAKEKVKKAVEDLGDSGSTLSTDLRRLLPLRFVP